MKTELIKFRVTPDLKKNTIKQAKSKNRTLSNYITDLIKTDLKQQNYV